LSILSSLGWLQVRALAVVEEVNLSAGCDEQSDKKYRMCLEGKKVRYKLTSRWAELRKY